MAARPLGAVRRRTGFLSTPQRLFFGVRVPDRVTAALQRCLKGAKDFPGRLGDPARWHLTLCFLGEVGRQDRDRLVAATAALPLSGAFELSLAGWGAFPNPRRGRVFWAGIADPTGSLGAVAAQLRQVAAETGLATDAKPYRPHLTVGRLRSPADLRSFLETLEPPVGSWTVDHFELIHSDLSSGAAHYHTLETFSL